MKIPAWAYVIGIFMMLFGGCSTLNDFQAIESPRIMEMQKNMIKGITNDYNTASIDSLQNESTDSTSLELNSFENGNFSKNMSESMIKMLEISDYSMKWIVRFGYIGIVVSLIYFFGGLFLMVKKPFSLKLVYTALILSIIFGVFQFFVLSNDPSGGFITSTTKLYSLFGSLIDVIFIVIILSVDKSAFYETQIE